MRTHVTGLAAILAALALAPLAHASTETSAAPPTATQGSGCFAVNTWQGWTTTADGDALYLRLNNRDIYRVDLTPGTHAWKGGDRFLVNKVQGSAWICTALDLNLTLADTTGFRQPLIATSLRKLTPEEIAAIPRKERP